MTTPILTTKLAIPPLRRDVLIRSRLLDRLDGTLEPGRQLAVLSAPAGFGKTILLATWLQRVQSTGAATGWLTLDEADADPARFVAYLTAAAQRAEPGLEQSARAPTAPTGPGGPDAALTALINLIAGCPRTMILVLDDYHQIHSLAVHRLLDALVAHAPANLRLAIATREDPPLPLARLRARDQVVELRQADLQFDLEEATVFLDRAAHAPLAPDQVAEVYRHTEGWAVGLQLMSRAIGRAASSASGPAPTGDQGYIIAYLIEEVLAQQPAAVRDFLLRTALLDRFNAPLCDAVTGGTDSRAVIAALVQANLFITPIDTDGEWHRYHGLFAAVLRHRFELDHPGQAAELHRRASRWYADAGYLDDAVRHAMDASDFEGAAELVGRCGEAKLKQGEIATLVTWCQHLPPMVIAAHPLAMLAYAWALALAGQIDPARALLDTLESGSQTAERAEFRGEVAAAQAYVARARGDGPALIRQSEMALSLLPASALTARGLVALNLGMAYWHIGRLDDAERALTEARDQALRSGNNYARLTAAVFLARTLATRGRLQAAAAQYRDLTRADNAAPILAIAHFDLCALALEWRDLAQAETELQLGLTLSRQSGNADFAYAGCLLQAAVAAAGGDRAAARAAVAECRALTDPHIPGQRARTAACALRVALSLGDAAEVGDLAAELDEAIDSPPFYRFLGLAIPLAQLALSQRAEAAERLDALYAKAGQAGWGYGVIAARVLQAIAAPTPSIALAFLVEALRLAEPEGYIQVFAEAGRPLVPLLQEAARIGVCAPYVGRILAAARVVARLDADLREPLSARELEVLRLVAAGLSNREIARKLVISTGTAKTHLHHVCGKLGVRNRLEAMNRGRALGLL